MAKAKKYDVDLVSLREGEYEEDFHIGKDFFEEMENSEILGADVEVHMTVEHRHGNYKFHFACDGTLMVPCDRCLDAVSIPVEEDYEVVVRYGEEYDDSNDGYVTIPENMTRLNVAGMIYDTLMLSIPLRCVHPEGECNSEMAAMLNAHRAGSETDGEIEDSEIK